MMIVLAIMAIILVVGAKNIGPISTEYKVWQISNQASQVHNGATSWRQNGVFTGVSMTALDPDYVPSDIGDGVKVNPYGGDVQAAANATDPYRLDITFTGIPDDAGNRLVRKYGADAVFTSSSSQVVITVGG